MSQVWRLQSNTAGGKITQYCLEHHVAALGWSLREADQKERSAIKDDFQAYCALAEKTYDKFDSVCRMAEEVRTGDLIWIRTGGRYYIGRVEENSKWFFNADEEAKDIDAANQLSNIFWKEISETADESSVPGAVATAFIRGSALQKIRKSGVEEYSQLLYNTLSGKMIYPNPKLTLTQDTFYSLLQPEDAEDLLCMWLYKEKGYICIPSTNKISTPKYECVLIDPNPESNKHIYIQVKKGDIDLDIKDYRDLNGEVYLLTTEGQVSNIGVVQNVYAVDPKELFEFAIDPDNNHLLPESIQLWIQLITDAENANYQEKNKGIMFDTNKAYSDTAEQEMLQNNQICAFGKAKRYIASFRKNDYVLYYSKGQGIMAAGRILSETATDFEDRDGKYHDVEILVPTAEKIKNKDYQYLYPKRIKELLNRNFYFASTIKTPYLSQEQSEILIQELQNLYNE